MLEILFRNQDFAAVSKPAGIAVHQEEGADNLLAMAAARLNVPRLWLTHRLDKPTSGVLLLALNAQAASELAQQFAAKTMRKTYLALSDRRPAKKQGLVKGGMEKSRRGAWKLTRGDGANPAERLFLHAWRLEFEYRGRAFSVCAPLDGRWPSEIPGTFRAPAVGL